MQGILSGLSRGKILGAPVDDVRVSIIECDSCGVDATATAARAACGAAVQSALSSESSLLLEPVMRMDVVTPDEFIGSIMSDLTSKRRGTVAELQPEGDKTKMCGQIPLASTVGYSTVLRTLAQGQVSFAFTFAGYAPVDEMERENILR